jgi:chorismate mutase
MTDPTSDPTVRRLRDAISDVDRRIVEAVNARVELVERLRRYKASQGMPFLDPERERQMLEDLVRANQGPVSNEALREFFGKLLDLTKREVTRED